MISLLAPVIHLHNHGICFQETLVSSSSSASSILFMALTSVFLLLYISAFLVSPVPASRILINKVFSSSLEPLDKLGYEHRGKQVDAQNLALTFIGIGKELSEYPNEDIDETDDNDHMDYSDLTEEESNGGLETLIHEQERPVFKFQVHRGRFEETGKDDEKRNEEEGDEE